MHPLRSLAQLALSLSLVLSANAETHTFKFVNECGYGTPMLIAYGQNVLNDGTYTSNGAWSGIGYLQTGYCGFNGENCTLLETTLINPTCAGCGSSTDLSLIDPHAYNVESSFAYYDGCDGQGKTCNDPECTDAAFFYSNDNFVQVACQTTDVNLLVAFCANASQIVLEGGISSGTTTFQASLPPSTLPTATSSLQTSPTATSSPPAPSSSLPASPSLAPSGTPNPGSSVPASVPPVTPTPLTVPTPTPTPTQTPAETSDLECGGAEPTTPSSIPVPTVVPSDSATSAPTLSTPTLPANPPPSLSPPPSATLSSTPSQKCIPRPSSFSLTNPASVPVYTPTFTPATTSAGDASDPCGDDTSAVPSASTLPARHRHRRTNRVRY